VLWLPTERELFKDGKDNNNRGPYSVEDDETGDNQAGLEYYTSANSNNSRKKKYGEGSMWYWDASAYSDSAAYFCFVYNNGFTGYNIASSVGGCAPAFCVGGWL
jgi:hypothetical protein